MKTIRVLRILLSLIAIVLGLTMTLTLLHFLRYGSAPILERGYWMVPAGGETNTIVLYLDFLVFGIAILVASALLVYDLWQWIKEG